jgi:DNA-binding IclR family transcriptional regulator
MGCIRQDPSTGRYALGLKLFELGQAVLANMDIRTVAMPFLLELSRKYEETVHLAILSGNEVIYIDKVDSPRSIRIVSKVGGRNPAYCTGVGKVLLAGLTNEELNRLLATIEFRPITPNTITNSFALMEEITKIRQDGYATDNGEIDEGLSCVAAPIRNHLGVVTAAISLSGPMARVFTGNTSRLVADVIYCARQYPANLASMLHRPEVVFLPINPERRLIMMNNNDFLSKTLLIIGCTSERSSTMTYEASDETVRSTGLLKEG